MLWIKWGLLAVGVGSWLGIVAWLLYRCARGWHDGFQWRPARRLAGAVLLGSLSLVLARSIVVVPSGMAGVRVSQISGTRPGTLFPGAHWVKPLVENVALYDTREAILTTIASAGPGEAHSPVSQVLAAQSREGLSVGLAVSVRYRLEPKRLDHIHSTLPQPVERELVPPIVASAFRQVLPNYMVREVFATRREEVRQKAARLITDTLAEDGIVVKEVMLRDVVLPAEYARGLEGLLLKEQESERMVYEIQIKEKQVRSAELEAEAAKARQVKKAEGDAQVHVLQAKAQADAMQHTLPLKEKQIQQSRLEAEARKESTLKNAEAAAQAKLIDTRAEQEKVRLMSDAEAGRIRVLAAADGERMGREAAALQQSPLLIQKIVAERLSDKMQIMMVPMDGKDFFATDIFRAASMMGSNSAPPVPAKVEDAPRRRTAQRR